MSPPGDRIGYEENFGELHMRKMVKGLEQEL